MSGESSLGFHVCDAKSRASPLLSVIEFPGKHVLMANGRVEEFSDSFVPSVL